MRVAFPDWIHMSSLYPEAKRLPGSTQLTFLWQQRVYQFPPEFFGFPHPHILRIVSRWIPPSKTSLLLERSSELKKLLDSQFSDTASTPFLASSDQGTYSDYLDGCITLEQYAQSHTVLDVEQAFKVCVSIAREIHRMKFGSCAAVIRKQLGFPHMLRDYYIQRLEDILRALNEETLIWRHADSLQLVKDRAVQHLEQIYSSIDAHERMCPVHGDYNPSGNILMMSDGFLQLIDLEQGLLGGDPIGDLRSLRIWDIGSLLPRLLSDESQKTMHQMYGDVTNSSAARMSLVRFDRLTSALIFKLLVEQEGEVVENRPLTYRPAEEVIRLIVSS